MQYRFSGIRMPVESPECELPEVVARRIGRPVEDLQELKILRRSLDARQRRHLYFEYSITVELDAPPSAESRAEPWQAKPFFDPDSGTRPMASRPIVVGTGPAGLLAAYYLALRGYRPGADRHGRDSAQNAVSRARRSPVYVVGSADDVKVLSVRHERHLLAWVH